MTSRVRLSAYSVALTAIITIVMTAICVITFHEKVAFYTMLAAALFMFIITLSYAPVEIGADPDFVTVRSVTRRQRIPLNRIERVELFQPTLGAYRLFASGGFMGYWGLFREGDVGRYMAYYGKASVCFMIRMKNGDKYVLGCKNPGEMVEYIKSFII